MLLDANQLCFAYGERAILQNACIAVEQGEIHVLLGPTGCGKSTLLKLLGSFLTPLSGRISVEGKPVYAPDKDRLMIFQSFDQFFPWLNLEQNLCFALHQALPALKQKARHELAQACLQKMCLQDALTLYPRELSGGMRQRAALAKALALKPKLLLLDEPFSSLDASSRRDAHEVLLHFHQDEGISMLMVTHDLEEAAALAKRITLWNLEAKQPGQPLLAHSSGLHHQLQAYFGKQINA
ncbi:MAG: ATP-binding cassette domain-containing protein [Clostridia bacterium]